MSSADRGRKTKSLADRLDAFLAGRADAVTPGCEPRDDRDAWTALARIHALHLAPIDSLGAAVQLQHHPVTAQLKSRLEDRLVSYLDGDAGETDPADATDPLAAIRVIARRDSVPSVYVWLAKEASRAELVEFVAIEGGPDGGFDDLVALCQVGLDGSAKLELARNYWDEMGRGDATRVHTELHRRCTRALGVPPVPEPDLPTAALVRTALNGLLATNRWLQPEFVGALGLLELQAGPRCRRVVEGMRRVGLRGDALEFYLEHAETDPRHGKDWLDLAVAPLAESSPSWAEGMVRGARWRSLVNESLFASLAERFGVDSKEIAA